MFDEIVDICAVVEKSVRQVYDPGIVLVGTKSCEPHLPV